MTVHLITIMFNEEKILPYFFRHYEQFVDKFIILDDFSTDNTVEILKQNPEVLSAARSDSLIVFRP